MQDDKTAKRESIQIQKFLMNSPAPRTFLNTTLSHIKLREKFFYGIRDSIFFLISPTLEEWKIISLPISLSFLYYILRLTRLLKKCLLVKKKTN